jgi:hypothetical protein
LFRELVSYKKSKSLLLERESKKKKQKAIHLKLSDVKINYFDADKSIKNEPQKRTFISFEDN